MNKSEIGSHMALANKSAAQACLSRNVRNIVSSQMDPSARHLYMPMSMELGKQPFQVLIGCQVKNNIDLRLLNFDQPLNSAQGIDDLFSMIVLRNREITKKIFQKTRTLGSNHTKDLKPLALDGCYSFSHVRCDVSINDIKQVPPHTIIIYQDNTSKWRILSNVKDFCFKVPSPIIDVMKHYYKEHYPLPVSDFAFSHEKKPMRVYAVEEFEDREIFHFEYLFSDTNVEIAPLIVFKSSAL